MNSELLASRLRSIGHETFAEYYRELSDRSVYNEALIEVLIADKGYALKSARTKWCRSLLAVGPKDLNPDCQKRTIP